LTDTFGLGFLVVIIIFPEEWLRKLTILGHLVILDVKISLKFRSCSAILRCPQLAHAHIMDTFSVTFTYPHIFGASTHPQLFSYILLKYWQLHLTPAIQIIADHDVSSCLVVKCRFGMMLVGKVTQLYSLNYPHDPYFPAGDFFLMAVRNIFNW